MSLSQTATVDTASPETVYKIYNSSGTEVASITTDSSGKGSSSAKLKNGTYTAVESKAPPGYALDTTRHTVRINNADATLNVSDVPLIKTVTLTKNQCRREHHERQLELQLSRCGL